MRGIKLVGDYVFERIGLEAQEVYRQNLLQAIRGDCDDSLHNKLGNVGAGVSTSSLDENGQLSDDRLRDYLDSMHLARVDSAYSDDWYWRFVLELAFQRRGFGSFQERVRPLYVQATGMSDRFAFSDEGQTFCEQLMHAWLHLPGCREFGFSLTPASIKLYERAGIAPHVAVIPAKRGGTPTAYVSDELREALATWKGRSEGSSVGRRMRRPSLLSA